MQKFEARSRNPEPQVGTAEAGAAIKACECPKRSEEASTDC